MFQANQQIGVYTLVKRIGDGVFGEVWLGKIRNTPAQVAIRLPNLEPNRSGAIPYPKVYVEWKSFEALHQEAKLWAKASGHKNILQIIEVGVYGGQIIIVGEPSEFDSLADKLQTPDKFSIEQAIKLCHFAGF